MFFRNISNYFDEEERRLVVQSFVIGVAVWAVVFGLKTAVHWLFETTLHFLEDGPSPLLAIPILLVGALIVAAITRTRSSVIHYQDDDGHIHDLLDVEGDGLERAISLYYSSEPSLEQTLRGQEGLDARWQMPTFSLAIRKWLATLATLGSGGSGGLEASVTLIGESVSAGLFKPRRTINRTTDQLSLFERARRWWEADNPDDLQTAQLSGIAAAVSTLLGAPFTAAFFATEVMYRQRPLIEKLVYSLISALTAYFLTNIFSNGHTAIFEVETLFVPPSDVRYFGVLVLLGAIISIMSVVFARLRSWLDDVLHHRQPNIWRRHLIGAAATAVIAIGVAYGTSFFGITDHGLELVLGPGESVIHMALNGELTLTIAIIALVAKMLATLTTISSGGSAGLLVPSLFFGSMVAAGMAVLFDYQGMMLVIPAMTASLVSIVNVPLAAILFTVEIFGARYMLPALIVLVVTNILAHNNTIYRTQRETISKRQILPGVSVRRVKIPAKWAGKTLISLDFRNRFGLNVIGLLELHAADGLPHVRMQQASTTVLEEGDILVVIGSDEKLEELETAVRAKEVEIVDPEASD